MHRFEIHAPGDGSYMYVCVGCGVRLTDARHATRRCPKTLPPIPVLQCANCGQPEHMHAALRDEYGRTAIICPSALWKGTA
jgi:predicted amidophosphoribosyltransferase